jgi:MFS family permease
LNLGSLTQNVKISNRQLAISVLPTSGTLAWFFFLNVIGGKDDWRAIFMSLTSTESSSAYFGTLLFFSSAVFWGLLGSLLSKRIERRKLLFLWILAGVLVSSALPLFQGTLLSILASVLLGFSLGFGLPSSMALIADYTGIEERGRVSGIIILLAFIMAFGVAVLSNILSLSYNNRILLSVPLRSVSLLAFCFDWKIMRNERNKHHSSMTLQRNFIFYIIPWIIVNIAAGLASSFIPGGEPFVLASEIGNQLRFIFIAVFGTVAGVIADRFGRKWPLAIGLLMFASSFAILGVRMSPEIATLYLAISGIAWGSFFVVFLAIPGDLSFAGAREKAYALGTISPLAILLCLMTVPPDFLSSYPTSPILQVLSLVLFLSLITLVFKAKETLPEKIILDRKIKEHIKKVLKETH